MFRVMSEVRDTVVLVRDDGPLQTIFVVPFMMSKNKWMECVLKFGLPHRWLSNYEGHILVTNLSF